MCYKFAENQIPYGCSQLAIFITKGTRPYEFQIDDIFIGRTLTNEMNLLAC